MRTRRLLALSYTASFQCTHGWRSRKVVGQNAGSAADRSNLYGIGDFLRHAHHQDACDELELNELAINGDGGA